MWQHGERPDTGLSRTGEHTVIACDVDQAALEAVSDDCAETTTDPAVATEADVVVVAVKPGLVVDVVSDLDLSPEQTLVSIAAGVPTSTLAEYTDATVVRIMPNLAAETGNMAAAATGAEIPDEVRTLLDDVGEFVEVEETQMDIATAVNGSGPAFVFYLIGAMRDAGVDAGLEPTMRQCSPPRRSRGRGDGPALGAGYRRVDRCGLFAEGRPSRDGSPLGEYGRRGGRRSGIGRRRTIRRVSTRVRR